VPDRQQGTSLSDGPPRWLLLAAIGVGTAAVGVVLIVAAAMHHARQTQPLALPSVSAPQAASPQCGALMAALPERLGDYRRAAPAEPVPPATAAWRAGSGGQAVVLRCGLPSPTDFVVGAPIQVVDAVQWFRQADTTGQDTTWFTVDRPVTIALTLPQGTGPTPIQEVSDVIAATIPAVPIRPGPAR
jgi:Protein of unknown function (DUF3515)